MADPVLTRPTLEPRPRPGDLITADWMDRIATAIQVDFRDIDDLRRRVSLLENLVGRRRPQIVAVDTNRFNDWVVKIRGSDVKILEVADKSARLEKAKDLWIEEREKVVLDDAVKKVKEPTEEEWVIIGTAAGILPSEVPVLLRKDFPATSRAIDSKLGTTLGEFDAFADLTTGKIF